MKWDYFASENFAAVCRFMESLTEYQTERAKVYGCGRHIIVMYPEA